MLLYICSCIYKSLGLIPKCKGKGKEDTHCIKYVKYMYQKVKETHPFVHGVQECMLVVITVIV